MKISVIVVNYNGKNFIGECLDSVLASNYPDFEVVVVDNASTDKSLAYLKKKYGKNKQVRIIRSDKQLFFTGGSNLGARKAGGKKLIFLNSDTVVDKNFIKELVEFTGKKEKCLVQPKILFHRPKNIVDNVGGKYSFLGFGFAKGRGEKNIGQYDQNSLIDYANGTCFMIDKKFFGKLGGFDEWYRYYYEDIDLSLRAKNQGAQTWYCYKSLIYHKGSLTFKAQVSNEKLLFNIRKNRLKTVIKNFKGPERALRASGLFLAYFIFSIQDLLSFRKKRLFLTLKSVSAVLNPRSLLLDNLTVKQTVFKNTFWLTLAEFISKIPIFFLNIWIVRYLGTQNYGKFAFAFAFCALFAIFADFGLSTLTVREVARNKNLARKYIDNLLVLKLILGFITFALTLLAIQFLGKPPEVKALVFLVAIFTIITSFIGFFQSIFQAFEKMEYLAISKIAYSISLFIIVLSLIWQKVGVKILTGGYVYSSLITLALTLILVRKKFVSFLVKVDLNFWKKTLSEAWSFGFIGLLGSMYFQMNTIQINLISTDSQTGLYNAAYQFIFILTILVNIFFTSLFPSLSKEYGSSKVNFYNILDFFGKKVILFCSIFCLVLFLVSKKLTLLLYGSDYLGSASILRVLLVSAFILFVNTIYSSALGIAGQQKEYLKSLLLGVSINFLLNFPLISLWGGLGASLTTVFSSSVVTILVVMKFKRLKKIDLQLI